MKDDEVFIFNDGYVLDRNAVLLASQRRIDSHSDYSIVCIIKDGVWRRVKFEDAAVSAAALPSVRMGFYLGANGKVLVFKAGQINTETIPGAAERGEMVRIRNVGEAIYACGMNGQVYTRKDTGWEVVGDGLAEPGGLALEDIGGTGIDDLWVVGSPNNVHHFDGGSWRRIDVPTDRPFGGVKSLSRDLTYF